MSYGARALCFILIALFSYSSLTRAQQQTPENDLYQSQAETPVVVLSALDKITTQLSTIEIRLTETVHFGTLEITMRHCRSNPPEETPESIAFLEIVDVGHNQQRKQVFTGWMFASSPALSPLEHPVYDVWVKSCKIVSGAESTARE